MTKHSKGVLLIDFDGTIVEHKWPDLGDPLPLAFEVLRELKTYGYALILWTCREDIPGHRNALTEAVELCRKNGVEFDAINETLMEFDYRSDYTDNKAICRKPHVNYCIDDTNLDGFPGWDWVRRKLLPQ